MPQIGTSGSMSGDGRRSDCPTAQATAPILDSTPVLPRFIFRQDLGLHRFGFVRAALDVGEAPLIKAPL